MSRLTPFAFIVCATTLVACGGSSDAGGAGALGGATSVGGSGATGGSKSSAGASATGGSKATGGASSSGTLSTGGLPAAGGASATGGLSATTGGASVVAGGASTTGGTVALGGTTAAGGSGGASAIEQVCNTDCAIMDSLDSVASCRIADCPTNCVKYYNVLAGVSDACATGLYNVLVCGSNDTTGWQCATSSGITLPVPLSSCGTQILLLGAQLTANSSACANALQAAQ
jgi:hypothetical protein